MSVLEIFILINYILAILSVLAMIIRAEKKPIKIFAWTVVLIVPFAGLIAYYYVGKGISYKTKRMLKKRRLKSDEYDKILKSQTFLNGESTDNKSEKYRDLAVFNFNNNHSIYSANNSIDIFTNGKDVLNSLLQDIENAQQTINIAFYIFNNDATGKKVRDLLVKKAEQGVKIKLIYDAVGSFKTSKHFFRKLIKNDGEVQSFFPPLLGIKMFNFYANYRNHRKIVVIDGKIAYTGGVNIRDDHMGLNKKMSPWRDTHLRIVGQSVASIQSVFIGDWRFVNKKYVPDQMFLNENYFPKVDGAQQTSGVQILTSSPEMSNHPIKECMIKMINSAKKTIKIQSPYFILDDTFKDCLTLALMSGVKVEIMFPKIADHKSVWYASLSYLSEIQKMGAKIYFYNGFIHSKTLSVDDEIVTIGSSNLDIRSFCLNFEINTLMFGNEITRRHISIFEKDKENCDLITEEYFKKMFIFNKFKMRFFKLFSAIF